MSRTDGTAAEEALAGRKSQAGLWKAAGNSGGVVALVMILAGGAQALLSIGAWFYVFMGVLTLAYGVVMVVVAARGDSWCRSAPQAGSMPPSADRLLFGALALLVVPTAICFSLTDQPAGSHSSGLWMLWAGLTVSPAAMSAFNRAKFWSAVPSDGLAGAPAMTAPGAPSIKSVFNAPPGWPVPADPNWLPPAGWAPDPSWPRPPVGWTFVIQVRGDAGVR